MIPKTLNNSGSILLVVLWIVIILSVLAFSLGRKTSIDLSLVNYNLAKQKAKYLAYSGLIYALNQMKQDKSDEGNFDTLYECGFTLKKGTTVEETFKQVNFSGGVFDIGFAADEDETVRIYGFSDEERRLNLNALNENNFKIFSQLLMSLDYSQTVSDQIAINIVDWQDEDHMMLGSTADEETQYLENSLSYKVKNRDFESMEELLLVYGMTPEIFNRIRKFITIYPKDAQTLTINMQTASLPVLQAVARSFAGADTNSYTGDADGLATDLISFRRGTDQRDATADDQLIVLEDVGVNTSERNIFFAMESMTTPVSNFFRIESLGTEENMEVTAKISAVVDRRDLSILSWVSE